MKVLQVITLFDSIYGAQKHVLDLSEGLKKRGHDVKILTGRKGIISQIAKSKHIDVIEFKSLKHNINLISDIVFLFTFIVFVIKEKPDYIHSHSSKAGILVRIVCFILNVPNCFTAHGWSFEDGIPFIRRNFYRIIETIVGFISFKVVAVSEYGKKYALDLKILNTNKIEVIPYGINNNDYVPNIKNYNDRTIVFIMVAGFREQKDHETLFKALKNINSFDWIIYFLGDGPNEIFFKKLSIDYGIESKCIFVGAVLDTSEYYKKSDIKILSTNWEGLPISILESLSYGLPVIATNVGGINEEVIDKWNGFLFKKKSVEELQFSLEKLLINRKIINELSINSRKLFEEKYTFELMIDKIENLYYATDK
jgi:glycosyltransferase involved in cell wall biosynthesis